MKGTVGFLFFLLFMAGFALVSLQAGQSDGILPAAGESPLTGHEWRPLRLLGVSVHGDTKLRVGFSGDGRIYGSAGCNRYSGRYDRRAGAFRVESMRATRRQCDDEIMALEAQLFEVFRDVREAELYEGDLRFLDEDGEWLATFTATAPAMDDPGGSH